MSEFVCDRRFWASWKLFPAYPAHIVRSNPIFRLLAAGSVLFAASSVYAQPRTYLNIGDPAPVLKPEKWLKGKPVPTFEKGKAYVVEFWATWCGPCKENIPHLTELAKQYAGKVSIIGVDVWESNDPEATTTIPKVTAFVKSQGDKMDYIVAADGGTNRVANAWMKAADEGGLPTSFIVGKDGKIAWIGHPKDLPAVLSQVVDDKFDVKAAADRRAVEVEETRPLREAMDGKDFKKALKLIDASMAKHPEKARFFVYDRMNALFHVDVLEAAKAADDIIDSSAGEIGAYQMLASIFASQKDLSIPAYKYGHGLIDKALEKGDRAYLFLAMQAEVNSSLGDKEGAVKSQEASVKAAEGDSHAPKEFVEFLRKNLERFKKAAQG